MNEHEEDRKLMSQPEILREEIKNWAKRMKNSKVTEVNGLLRRVLCQEEEC